MAQPARKPHRSPVASTERLEARVRPEQKALFQRAASLRGVSLTDFVLDSVSEAAVRTVQEHEFIQLAAEESKAFVSALMNPPEPNPALREATERYNRMISR